MASPTHSTTESKRANHTPAATVIYNGQEKSIEFQPQAAIQALLQHAAQAFGIHQNAHLLGLFSVDGVELDDRSSAADAGVKDGSRLLLRPSAVRGGGQ